LRVQVENIVEARAGFTQHLSSIIFIQTHAM